MNFCPSEGRCRECRTCCCSQSDNNGDLRRKAIIIRSILGTAPRIVLERSEITKSEIELYQKRQLALRLFVIYTRPIHPSCPFSQKSFSSTSPTYPRENEVRERKLRVYHQFLQTNKICQLFASGISCLKPLII